MANKKITDLSALGATPASGDLLVLVDVSDTSEAATGTTKKIVYSDLVTAGGDASTNTSTSVDSEIALFSGTGGKTLKRATTSGILKGTSGVIGQATANDLASPIYAADAGSTDAYAITLSPSPGSYQTGALYRFKANTANTGAATLNINSIGAVTIKKVAGGITTDLDNNDIRVGQFVDVVYDGTNFQMQSTLGNAGSGGGLSGTLTSGRVPFASGASTLTDDSRFTFSTASAGKLTIPAGSTTVPGLEISGGSNNGFSDWTAGGSLYLVGGGVRLGFGDGVFNTNFGGYYFSSGSTPTNTPDSGTARYAASQTGAIRNNLNALGEFVARAFYCEPRTVANLPTGAEGMIARVTNATATTVGSTVAGGGANHVYVAHDGSNWIIMTAF